MNDIPIYSLYHSSNPTTHLSPQGVVHVKWKSRHNSRTYIYAHMESVDYSSHSTTTLFWQDYRQHNHLGWIYNHSHFYLSFKYPSITCWVILISVSFHPRQKGDGGFGDPPFFKAPQCSSIHNKLKTSSTCSQWCSPSSQCTPKGCSQ